MTRPAFSAFFLLGCIGLLSFSQHVEAKKSSPVELTVKVKKTRSGYSYSYKIKNNGKRPLHNFSVSTFDQKGVLTPIPMIKECESPNGWTGSIASVPRYNSSVAWEALDAKSELQPDKERGGFRLESNAGPGKATYTMVLDSQNQYSGETTGPFLPAGSSSETLSENRLTQCK